MSTTFKTPGVYLRDIGKLPLSVTQVATAVPVFVGYTESAEQNGDDVTLQPVRVGSLAEYETVFGGAPNPADSSGQTAVEITFNASLSAVNNTDIGSAYFLYHSLQLYFEQGGADCFIVSVGDYKTAVSHTQINLGFDAVEDEDDPTLLVCPDLAALSNGTNIGLTHQHMLKQCFNRQDRFAILDVPQNGTKTTDDAFEFRGYLGQNYLNYGAAYAPYLRTTLGYDFSYEDLDFFQEGVSGSQTLSTLSQSLELDLAPIRALEDAIDDLNELRTLLGANHGVSGFALTAGTQTYREIFDDESIPYDNLNKPRRWAVVIRDMVVDTLQLYAKPGVANFKNEALLESLAKKGQMESELSDIIRTLYGYDLGANLIPNASNELNVVEATDFDDATPYDFGPGTGIPSFDYLLGSVAADNSAYGDIPATVSGYWEKNFRMAEPAFRSLFNRALAVIQELNEEAEQIVKSLEVALESVNPLYALAAEALRQEILVMPPSGSIAGAYVATDRTRGVFKAPANLALENVAEPDRLITNFDQDYLNIDPVAGKSINAIRALPGRGTLIWGARTLDGNNPDWRYVPVRRLYINVEESLRKASEFVVFEPNNANTWLRVKSMIANYLTGLWRQGALAGASRDEAYYVRVGVNETMTSDDILNGRMIIEVGMAAVRPAEFVVIKFTHRLQEI